MESIIFPLFFYFAGSKRTSRNWLFQYYFIFNLALLLFPLPRKGREKFDNIYSQYISYLLYSLLRVLSLATIIASRNWNCLILFFPRKSHDSRIIINYERQRTNLHSSKCYCEDWRFHFFVLRSTITWPRLLSITEFAPAWEQEIRIRKFTRFLSKRPVWWVNC